MNLDEWQKFAELDPQDMLAQIDRLPEMLEEAWQLGLSLPLAQMGEIRSVVLAGMGGSAIGAELVRGLIVEQCLVPVVVHRDYDLPAWAKGRGTLVVLSSHSGNTEETLSAFNSALHNQCQIVTITTGGKLHALAQSSGLPAWKFNHTGQPRAAVAYSFGLLMALFTRLGLITDPQAEILSAVVAMKEARQTLKAENPIHANPAKRQAGQMLGRTVTVFGAGHLAAVARRWKGQINEVAKALANFEEIPEADHNAITGIFFPPEECARWMAVFLKSTSDHPRNQMRLDLTRQTLMVEGINTDIYLASGKSKLEQMWKTLQFGDYTAFYLAMAYEVDPSITPAIDGLKQAMK
ncbi:MAG: bifunctional phosphoglucose/phosphomannose isomerase [Anaerolineaceae bacterium]|nr:bifunctional phosphoglucose/phosphomannose isomerase [Anaerolineaceae bacterium]